MNRIALATVTIVASFGLVGCGFVDQDIHLSDEELRAESGLSSSGSGGMSFGSGTVSSHGCGIGIGHHHTHRARYDFGESVILGKRADLDTTRPSDSVAGQPTSAFAAESAAEDPNEPDAADPVPRDIDTWGEMVEWHYKNAQRRGEVDHQTELAVDAMRR